MAKISKVMVGESLVGDGNEVAHMDLLIGPRGSAVETAFCNALTNNKDGFTSLLAVIAPNLQCKPNTVLFNKVTIKGAKQAVQMFGPAQHAVAKAVQDTVADGIIPGQRGGRRVHLRRRVHPLGRRGRRQDPGVQLPGHEGSHPARGRRQAYRRRSDRPAGPGEASFRGLDTRQPRTGKTLCRTGWSVAPAEGVLGPLTSPLRRYPFGADSCQVRILSAERCELPGRERAVVERGGDQGRGDAERRQRADVGFVAHAAGGDHRAASGFLFDFFKPREIGTGGCADLGQRHDDHLFRPQVGLVEKRRRAAEPVAEKIEREDEVGMIAKTPEQRVVALQFGTKHRAERRFCERGGQRFRIGETGIHPEFRRVRHGSQSGQRGVFGARPSMASRSAM